MVDAAQRLLVIDPDRMFAYGSWPRETCALERFDEAERALQQAHARGLESIETLSFWAAIWPS